MARRGRRARDENLEALLRGVSDLRLTLDADLTVAAAAAEANRLDLAAEIVEFDRTELEAFAGAMERRVGRRGRPPELARKSPRVRLRQRFALAAAPAMLTAAAIVALVGMSNGTSKSSAGSIQPQLVASYSALAELARTNRDPAALVAVGDQLNRSVAQLIAGAKQDPSKARLALRILIAEQQLLTARRPNGAETLLAQARALVRRLEQTVPTSMLKDVPAPMVRPSSVSVPTALSAAAVSTPPTQATPSPEQIATHSPAPAPQPPTPEPTSGEATVSPEPSPEPSFVDPWPFGTHK